MSSHYLGIDLHKQEAFWTLINKEGEIVKQQSVKVVPLEIKQALKDLPSDTQVALEPVGDFIHYCQIFEEQGFKVKIATPAKVKAIAWNKLKHDRVDSEILAQLLRVGYLPATTLLRSHRDYSLRQLTRLRNSLVRIRAQLKQRLSLLKSSLQEESTFEQTFQQESLKRAIQALSQEIKALDNYLKETWQNHQEIKIITSLPGCGLITALTVKAEVGDFSRFKKAQKLTAWAGLVPISRDSAGKIKRGHITRQGSHWLRYALYEAALNVKEDKNDPLWLFYERIAQKGSKKKARTALARKLLSLMWYLIKKDEYYLKKPA